GGSAAPAGRVPGVEAGPVESGVGLSVSQSAGEFDHAQLGDQDGTGFAEPADDARLGVDDTVAKRRRSPRRRVAGSGQQIFGTVGNPLQRAAIDTGGKVGISLSSLFAG